jgi:hypothetical protein
MISVRFGPASTWQWWQAWLQRLPTFTWSVRALARRSGRALARERVVEAERRRDVPRPLLIPSAPPGNAAAARDTDGTPMCHERPGALRRRRISGTPGAARPLLLMICRS